MQHPARERKGGRALKMTSSSPREMAARVCMTEGASVSSGLREENVCSGGIHGRSEEKETRR